MINAVFVVLDEEADLRASMRKSHNKYLYAVTTIYYNF